MMKKVLGILTVFILVVSTMVLAAPQDALISVQVNNKGNVYTWAKWSLLANIGESVNTYFPLSIWHKTIEPNTIFLILNDVDLANIKAALTTYRIRFQTEILIELTAQEITWLESAGIRDRSEIPAALKRAQSIDNASSLNELKLEVLKRPVRE